jgi:transposase InsO family protein
MMWEDNLLGVQPKRFVVTTNSSHKLEVYLNLASRMKVTGINQLWVADINYIRLQAEFVYLAMILDGFSRRVVALLAQPTQPLPPAAGILARDHTHITHHRFAIVEPRRIA